MDRAQAKQRLKQAVRSTVGEPYVGKRLKLRCLARVMPALHLAPRAVLDAGAEDATFVYWLAHRYPQATVTAVDIDADAVAACLAARPERYSAQVDFVVGEFADLESSSFDLVTAFDVLEHIPDDEGAVAELYRVLRPGGTLLVHVPRNVWTDRSGRRQEVPDEEAWRINPGHVRHGYSPERLRALVEGAGFEVLAVDTWLRRWSVRAFDLYGRVEKVPPLRLLTLPFTDLAAALDRRRPPEEGNSVWLHAVKPARRS